MPKRTGLINKSLGNFCEKFGSGRDSKVPILGIAKNSKEAQTVHLTVDTFMANLGCVRLSDNPIKLDRRGSHKKTQMCSCGLTLEYCEGFLVSELRRFLLQLFHK